MKKFIVAAVIAIVAAVSFSTSAEARGRNGGFAWHHGHGGGSAHWRGHGGRYYGGRHHGYRHSGFRYHGYRHYGGRHYGGRYYGWGPGYGYWGGGYWGGPSIVIAPGYYGSDCVVRKVRRYDAWGNVRIRRVRVCDY